MASLPWIIFVAFVLGMLALDVSTFHKRAHAVTMKEATLWTAVWVAMALIFNGLLYFLYEHDWLGLGQGVDGATAAAEFFTGWLVEKSLSLDNVFVFALIFAYFKVPAQLQHRVLFWGIIGALILRGVMIAIGTALISHFDFMGYVFGLLLFYAAIKMLFFDEGDFNPEQNLLFRTASKLFPVTQELRGEHFFVRQETGRLAMTPLFLVLLVVESSDVLFAVDSIPAVFGITHDPFIVFTSNIFAILGLRSLYFVLAAMMSRFDKLKYSLVLVLLYIGAKMMLEGFVHIPTHVSLILVTFLLVSGVVASLVMKKETSPQE